MMKSKFWFSAVLSVLVMGMANAKVTVVLQKPGPYAAYLYSGNAVQLMHDAKNVRSVVFDDAGVALKGGWSVIIANTEDGNEVRLPVPATGQVVLKPEAMNAISSVVVQISDAKGGKPDSGLVTLKDGKGKSQSRSLLPSDAGRVVFEHVMPGNGSVTFQQGTPGNAQTLSVRLPLKRDKPMMELAEAVTLPEGMKTAAASQAAPVAEPEVTPRIGHSLLTGFVGYLIALAVLVGAVVLGVRYLRGKGITAESALSAVGVQLPDDPEPIPIVAAEPPVPVDPTICPFCGARKEANAPCANCAVAASPVIGAASSPSGPPRLVALTGPHAGAVITLNGSLTVGRDPAQGIAIPGDPSLSRHHATLEASGSGASIVDAGSSNGSWVNGRRVERADLRPGDEIVLGASRFRYEV